MDALSASAPLLGLARNASYFALSEVMLFVRRQTRLDGKSMLLCQRNKQRRASECKAQAGKDAMRGRADRESVALEATAIERVDGRGDTWQPGVSKGPECCLR
jgi:hypothetical protein